MPNIGHRISLKSGGEFKITLARTGFHKTRFRVSKWNKHGEISLVVAGHDPPVDLTIFVDVALNPRPSATITSKSLLSSKFFTRSGSDDLDLHIARSTITTYSRNELFKISRLSNVILPCFVLAALKNAGILHFRGKRHFE